MEHGAAPAHPSVDTCWPWKGSVDDDGYGEFVIEGVTYPAHRVAFVIATGLEDEGWEIVQTCKDKLCQNPAHLIANS